MHISNSSKQVVPVLAGAVGAASLQTRGWWLNSGRGVAFTVIGLFLLGVVFGRRTVGSRRTRAAALWVGCVTGLAASLFWIGPGASGRLYWERQACSRAVRFWQEVRWVGGAIPGNRRPDFRNGSSLEEAV